MDRLDKKQFDAHDAYGDLTITESLPLPEMVFRKLKGAILNGIFRPGQVLRQEEVAVQLGVSRSPLREALPRLEAEGLVVYSPRRGYSVLSLESREIAEVFDLRVLLEVELCQRSMRARDAADIALVRSILTSMAALAGTYQGGDRTRWFELNSAFHRALLAPANCRHFMRAWEITRSTVESYIRMEVNLTGDIDLAQQEHAELVEAFADGHANRMAELLRAHSINTYERLIDGLTRRASPSMG